MPKTILITGSTDGIGLETARMLAAQGHRVLVHGRNPEKVERVADELNAESYVADLSRLSDVESLAKAVMEKHETLDVLINNAGVFRVPNPLTAAGLDVRFVVNTVAPYLLAKRLLPLFDHAGRIVNLSSAAQAPLSPADLTKPSPLSNSMIYAQSKLALTMWSFHMAAELGDNGPAVIAVNPASMLGSKMVKEAYGVRGGDLRIGADILCRAALSDEFADASGKYFDNDSGQFAPPHPDARNPAKCTALTQTLDTIINP